MARLTTAPSDEDLNLALDRIGDALHEAYRTRPSLWPHPGAGLASFKNAGGGGVFRVVMADDVLDSAAQERVEVITSMLQKDDYKHRKRATCAPAHVTLQEYSGYKKLFEERKHAFDYGITEFESNRYTEIPDHDTILRKPSTAPVVEFMQLPGEIRNRIYKYFLVLHPEIDIAPKSSSDNYNSFSYAEKRQKKLLPILRLLRLSLEINREAANVYYSENEFRFSCGGGWCFLRKIGSANVARLRRLAVGVPYEGRDTDAGYLYEFTGWASCNLWTKLSTSLSRSSK